MNHQTHVEISSATGGLREVQGGGHSGWPVAPFLPRSRVPIRFTRDQGSRGFAPSAVPSLGRVLFLSPTRRPGFAPRSPLLSVGCAFPSLPPTYAAGRRATLNAPPHSSFSLAATTAAAAQLAGGPNGFRPPLSLNVGFNFHIHSGVWGTSMQHEMSDIATQTRDLIRWAGGPMWPGDNLKSYFWRLHKQTGDRLSVRVIRAAWQGQQISRRTVEVLREAQGRYDTIQLANHLEAVANTLDQNDATRHREEIGAIRSAIGAIRGMDGI